MHYIITGRVSGWDEDAAITYEAETADEAVAEFKEDLREMERVSCDVQWQQMLDDGEVFINSVHESATPIRISTVTPS